MASIARRSKKRKAGKHAAPEPPAPLVDRLRRHTPPLAPRTGYADEVIAASRAEGRARGVLYVLANHADTAEEVEMGQDTLALTFDVKRSTIARVLRHLRKLGELTLIRRAGWHHTNRYRITVSRETKPSSP